MVGVDRLLGLVREIEWPDIEVPVDRSAVDGGALVQPLSVDQLQDGPLVGVLVASNEEEGIEDVGADDPAARHPDVERPETLPRSRLRGRRLLGEEKGSAG